MATIQSYKPEWAGAFKALNMAWLQKFFVPEAYDVEVLSNPDEYILNKNGDIYFVVEEGRPVGTVALMYNNFNELEFTKMAVDEAAQGKGYGSMLMQHCIDEAKAKGASQLVLYSNTRLASAINLYRKFDFVEVPVLQADYERCNIKMVKYL